MAEQQLEAQSRTFDVSAQRVARTYAEALLNSAEKQGQGDSVLEELDSLVHDLFPANPKFVELLSSSAISRKDKEAVLEQVFRGRTSQLFLNFLSVLNEHDRLELLRVILTEARALHDQRTNRIRVQVSTATPLPEDQREQLIRQLRASFQREPLLETQVDPGLLGGMVVRVGDWLYDASVRTRLDSIRHQLIESSSYEIQSRRDRFGNFAENL